MKTIVNQLPVALLIGLASMHTANADVQITPSVNAAGDPEQDRDNRKSALRLDWIYGGSKLKSTETLRCFQHGVRIVNEELAEGTISHISETGIATVGDGGENITVVSLGDSFCILHGKKKPIAKYPAPQVVSTETKKKP